MSEPVSNLPPRIPGFRSSEPYPDRDVYFFLDHGGLGDHLARLPAIRYAVEHYPFIRPRMVVPVYFLPLGRHLLPDPRVEWLTMDEMRGRKTPGAAAVTFDAHPITRGHSSRKTHLTAFAFRAVLDRDPPDAESMNYLRVREREIPVGHFGLRAPYVVMTPCYTSPVRELRPRLSNQIARHLRESGLEVVFLGSLAAVSGMGKEKWLLAQVGAELDLSLGRNLINQTSLLESAAIIAGAELVVGLDNGLLHLAGCTDTPILGAYTTVDPQVRLPVRTRFRDPAHGVHVVEPPAALECRYCQSSMTFVYQHNFKQCYYGDFQCLDFDFERDFLPGLNRALRGRMPTG